MSTPSPSTVAYLFADRFVPTAKDGEKGMRAFGTGAVVVTGELAAGLVAIGLWQLRERGAVTLAAFSSKKLGFISTSGVRVTRTGDGDFSGVEKRLLDVIDTWKKARTEGVSAWDVANMVCRDGDDPNYAVTKIAVDEAVSLGYLDRVAQGAGKSPTTLEPQAERIATLQPDAETLAVSWREFRQGAEAEMVKLLRSTTYDGIEVRARRDRR